MIKPHLIQKKIFYLVLKTTLKEAPKVNISNSLYHISKTCTRHMETRHKVFVCLKACCTFICGNFQCCCAEHTSAFLRISKSSKLFHSALLSSACGQTAEGDELHGGFFQRVPAVVPCDPNDAVVEAIFTCVLFCVPAAWTET